MKYRHKLILALIGATLLIPKGVCATEKMEEIKTEQVEIDWKTAIDEEVDLLFKTNEYKEPKTLYTTTYLNMRKYPNIKTGEVELVFKPNVKVKAISEYNGWTKIVRKSEDGEKYYYLWNEYLSEEKVEESVEDNTQVPQVVPFNKYLGEFKLTAYCPCVKCCGKSDGITASGTKVKQGRTVAMYGIPFGTKLLINGHVYTVEDRGTPYGHVDIYFNSHSDALEFGVKYADVYKVN